MQSVPFRYRRFQSWLSVAILCSLLFPSFSSGELRAADQVPALKVRVVAGDAQPQPDVAPRPEVGQFITESSSLSAQFPPLVAETHLRYAKTMDLFDVQAFLAAQNSPLANQRILVKGEERKISEVITEAALISGINPRILLVLIEIRSNAVSSDTDFASLSHLLGPEDWISQESDFENEIHWAAKTLNQNLESFKWESDVQKVVSDTNNTYDLQSVVNPASLTLYKLAAAWEIEDWHAKLLDKENGFVAIYQRWFGDPLHYPSFLPAINGEAISSNWLFPYAGSLFYTSGPHAYGAMPVCQDCEWKSICVAMPREDAGALDFARGEGSHVLAIDDGVVVYIAPKVVWPAGQFVVVKHHTADIASYYMHMRRVNPELRVGMQISRGFFLGEEGDPPGDMRSHLHLEIRMGGSDNWVGANSGIPASWEQFTINGWQVGMHRLVDNESMGYAYQGSLVRNSSKYQTLRTTPCSGRPNAVMLVSEDFPITETQENNNIDGYTVFAGYDPMQNRPSLSSNNIEIKYASDSGVTLYELSNYQGYSLTLTTNDFDLCDNPLDPSRPPLEECFTEPSWTDNASSMKVTPGWKALLFKHNLSDAQQWGDDSSQRVQCDSDIPDFGPLTFEDGTPLDNNVSRIYVARCAPSGVLHFNNLVAESTSTYDPCVPELPPSSNEQAVFLNDVTLPDGTVVSPGASLVKTWRVRNTGTTTWGGGYQLVFVGGNQMGAPGAVNIPAASPGQEVDLSVNIVAPSSNGTYTGYWRLRNPQGTFFGPTLFVKINVQTTSGYITILSTDPPSPADTSSVQIRVKVEGFPNLRATRLLIDGEIKYELGGPEFIYPWDTNGYAVGDHSIVVEVADQTDTSWSHPERRAITYRLLGTGAAPNHAPYRPTPTSPYDWYVYYSGNTAQLCAQANGDPDGDAIAAYYFNVYESAQLWNSGWVAGNCVTTAALGPYTYQWRVKVRDSLGAESDWSDTWHFTLVNPTLSITELYFQPQDADSEVVKIRACTAGQGGVGITMRVSVNDATDGSANGTWHIIKELGVPCFNDEDAPIWRTLEYGSGDHRVRVEAHGVNVGWDGAAVRDEIYNLPHRRPPSPNLVAPVPLSRNTRDPIYLNTRTMTFKWTPALRAENYTLHVGTEPSPQGAANPLLRQTFASGVTEFTHTFSEDHPVLYWQVTASNDKGSNTSSDQQMGIDRTPPTCVVQPLPAVSYENAFQVTWSGADGVSGVRSYAIQYLDSERGDWGDWVRDVPSTQTYALFTGKEGHTYGFRCVATDRAGNTSTYPGAGDTSIKVDPTMRPPTLWWRPEYAAKRNIIVLNNMNNMELPVGYPVSVRFDSTTTPSAAEVYNASLSSSKCDDLRVVYNDTTQLQRVVRVCSSTEIEIWFRTQVSVPAGASDSAAHQLYYGNANPGAPPADPNQVWYPYYESDTQYLFFFQEGSGATTYDSSGYGRHCTIDPSVAWAPSKFGGGLRFNRANNGDSYSLTCGSSALPSFTIEFWLKPDADGDGRIAGQIKGGVGLNWLLNVFDGRIRLDVWPCTTCGSSEVRSNFDLRQAPYVGNWNHIAVTFNGGNEVKFYINGTLDSVKYLAGNGLTQHNIPLEIGSVEGMSQLKDNLGTFRISTGLKTSFPYGTYALITNEPATQAGAPIPPPITGTVDLRILEVSTYPSTDGGVLVQAVLRNDGTLPTQNGFFNDLYLNDVPSGTGDYTGSVHFWINEPIAAGATVTLTSVITDVTGLIHQAMSDAPCTEITGTLRVLVDSSGVLNETDENNNMNAGGTEMCIASGDVFENDDSISAAKTLLLDQAQTRNINKLGDQDWAIFAAEAGKTYIITTSDLGIAADTYLYLYDTDGTTLLAANDDDGNNLASRIEWAASADGTYYILVKHWNPNVSGCGTGYTLNLTEARPFYNIYLPLTLRAYVPPTPVYTLRLTALSGDGEIGNTECADWAACHSATTGNFLFDTLAQATVATSAYSDMFDIKRVFLSFDPSALPENAKIVTATLSFYAGPYQHGSTRIVIVPSVHETELRRIDFGNALIGIVGGTAEPEANQWVHVPLTDLMLNWIGLDEMTGFALVHKLDYYDTQPAELNDLVVSLSEHEGFEPYLTIQYQSVNK